MSKKKVLIPLFIVVAGAVVYFGATSNLYKQVDEQVIEQVDYNEQLKQKRIDEIRESQDFQEFINKELDKRYYEEIKNNAIEQLKKIEGSEEFDQDKSARALREYLEQRNPELAQHADYIVTLPRWIEVVAITSKETSFCTKGVGSSRNNCGAIKNSSTGQFKHYKNKLNAVEDIAILLQRPLYKDLTIEQMNGIYCQDASRPGRKCLNWDDHIMAVVQEIKKTI